MGQKKSKSSNYQVDGNNINNNNNANGYPSHQQSMQQQIGMHHTQPTAYNNNTMMQQNNRTNQQQMKSPLSHVRQQYQQSIFTVRSPLPCQALREGRVPEVRHRVQGPAVPH